MTQPFHLAIPVRDLDQTRDFYIQVLGCGTGRSSDHWQDLDMFGHQLVLHMSPKEDLTVHNPVDGDQVPVPHFGVVLTLDQFANMSAKLLAHKDTDWVIKPRVRFQGEIGEQHTMFFKDPSGNALEFKAFADMGQLFAH
jgi:Predicted dioxygenase of extradiol dioxygenase family|tara:strand:+ start:1860 stop:2276 length:417 start_codon:yes stop_codon:yes gene_type:complete